MAWSWTSHRKWWLETRCFPGCHQRLRFVRLSLIRLRSIVVRARIFDGSLIDKHKDCIDISTQKSTVDRSSFVQGSSEFFGDQIYSSSYVERKYAHSVWHSRRLLSCQIRIFQKDTSFGFHRDDHGTGKPCSMVRTSLIGTSKIEPNIEIKHYKRCHQSLRNKRGDLRWDPLDLPWESWECYKYTPTLWEIQTTCSWLT